MQSCWLLILTIVPVFVDVAVVGADPPRVVTPVPDKRLSPDMGKRPSSVCPSSLRVVSYNVQFLPGLARYTNERSMPIYRAKQIAEKMSAFDIVGLNETFDDEPRKLIHTRIGELWGEDCHILYGPVPNDARFNGGLSLISRFPFLETHSVIYKNFSSPLQYGFGADGFAAKGVLHARLAVPETRSAERRMLDVFVTHLEARDGSLRRKQFDELADFLSKHTSEDREFLLLGDLNTRGNVKYRADSESTYNQLFGVLKDAVPEHRVVDAWPTLNPKKDGGTKCRTKPGGGPRIDYIIIGQPKRTSPALQVSEIRVNPYLDDKVQSLSDHSAVEATLKWNHRPPVSAHNGVEDH